MHTIHWIAVEAESVQEAFESVESALTPDFEGGYNFASWSDWHVVGGGRWNVQEGEAWQTAYVDGRTNMVLSYKDNPDEFTKQLQQALEWRVDEMNRLITDINFPNFIEALNAYVDNDGQTPDEYRRGMNSWYVRKAASLIGEVYMAQSYFYDLENYTPSLSYLADRLRDNPDIQYLVPVDFHY